MTKLAGKEFSPGVVEILDRIVKKARAKESPAEREQNQPFYDFLALSLLEPAST